MKTISAVIPPMGLWPQNIDKTREFLITRGFVFDAQLTRNNPKSLHPVRGTSLSINWEDGIVEQKWETFD